MLRSIILLFLLFLTVNPVEAFLPKNQNPLVKRGVVKEEYYSNGFEYISKETGKPVVIYNRIFQVNPGTPQKMAEDYFTQAGDQLGISKDLSNIRFVSDRIMPGGPRVRFIYQYKNLPVYGGSITVSLNKNNEVVFVVNRYKEIPSDFIPVYDMSTSTALERVKAYLGIFGTCIHEISEKCVYSDSKSTRAAIRVELAGNGFVEHWEVLIDAISGEFFRVEDKACYSPGYVFDPDPVTRHRTQYGEPGFIDDNNADCDSLLASLVEVELGPLVYECGNYRLQNDFAFINDFASPLTGIFEQQSDTFLYSRSNDAFEAVNCFYHITQSMKYVNDTLLVYVRPIQFEGGVQFDPDAMNNEQNAFYSWGRIGFGKPLDHVDAAESHAIIHHELGHGIHDWVTNMNLSQVEGLSEGVADYWAQSYKRSHGCFTPEDEQYDWLVVWGLHPWGDPYLRVTNYCGHYPEDLVDDVHTDGQMLSSSLMSIYDQIGRNATDRLLLEALSMTDGYIDQPTFARAFACADNFVYSGIHLETILQVFLDRGYFQSLIEPTFVANTQSGLPPLSVHFYNTTSAPPGVVLVREWDFNSDGFIDSYLENPLWIYNEPGSYDVTYIVVTEEYPVSVVKKDFIVVTGDVLIWDFKPGNNSSGLFFKEYLLENIDTEVVYTTRFPENLDGVNHLFISLGNVGDTINAEDFALNDIVEPLVNYINNGGNVFLEGGTPFETLLLTGDSLDYQEMRSCFNFNETFISSEQNPVNDLYGHTGSFAEGMQFIESNQDENGSIQYYTPGPGADAVFTEEDLGIVGIANENDYGGRTICFSYAISELSPNGGLNTREELMRRICEYYGIGSSNKAESETDLTPSYFKLHSNYPNPFNATTRIEFDVPVESLVSISVFDILGREVAVLENKYKQAGRYVTQWSTQNGDMYSISSGIYFLVMRAREENGRTHKFSQKIVFLK